MTDQEMDCPQERASDLKPWLKRSASDLNQIPPDVKRRRRNYRLKKLVSPKNPLMVLNELKPGLQYNVTESLSKGHIMYTATVEYEPTKIYSGTGLSKKDAQREAAENVLKDLFYDKLLNAHLGRKAEDSNEKMESAVEDHVNIPEDETPWSSIASLALYKLMKAWSPDDSHSTDKPYVVVPDEVVGIPRPMKKIPDNAASMDPVLLLHHIFPKLKFQENEVEAIGGEYFFTLSTEVRGETYTGTGKNKKCAKKACAKKVLAKVLKNVEGIAPSSQ